MDYRGGGGGVFPWSVVVGPIKFQKRVGLARNGRFIRQRLPRRTHITRRIFTLPMLIDFLAVLDTRNQDDLGFFVNFIKNSIMPLRRGMLYYCSLSCSHWGEGWF